MDKRIFLALFLGIVLLSAYGCIDLGGILGKGNGEEDTTEDTTGGTTQNKPTPSFTLVYPTDGEYLEIDGTSTSVEVLLSTTNLLLVPPTTKVTEGQGHFVLKLDGGAPITIWEIGYLFEDVAVGEHILEVELKKSDGTSYSPAKKSTVTFTVASKEPVYKEVEITIANKKMSPVESQVNIGDTVTWVNNDATYHIIVVKNTVTRIVETTSGPLQPGQSFSYTFTVLGEYEMYSQNYPPVHGTIIVSQ